MSIADNNASIQAIVTKDLKYWLQQRAKTEGRSLSNYVSFLLEQVQQTNQKQSNGNQANK